MKATKFFIAILCICGMLLSIFGGVWLANVVTTSMIELEGKEIEPTEPLDDRIYILVLGTDSSGNLSDTIMLTGINTEEKTVSVMSILRDTRVYSNGYGHVKINSLIGHEDKELATISAVEDLTGITVNYYATVSFKAFRDAIDILGGVEYDVPDVRNRFSNGRAGMYYDDPYQDLHIAIPAGLQVLNGEQAEGLVRFRDGYADADMQRVKVQQDFMKELVKQKLNLATVAKANKILDVIKDNVRTNLSASTIRSLVSVIKDMNADDIRTFSLPGEAEYINNISYYVPDDAETAEIIQNYFVGSFKEYEASLEASDSDNTAVETAE